VHRFSDSSLRSLERRLERRPGVEEREEEDLLTRCLSLERFLSRDLEREIRLDFFFRARSFERDRDLSLSFDLERRRSRDLDLERRLLDEVDGELRRLLESLFDLKIVEKQLRAKEVINLGANVINIYGHFYVIYRLF
jgi:hypothetical protein